MPATKTIDQALKVDEKFILLLTIWHACRAVLGKLVCVCVVHRDTAQFIPFEAGAMEDCAGIVE